MKKQNTIDSIFEIGNSIDRNIRSENFLSRGEISQDVIKKIRDLAENVMLLINLEDNTELDQTLGKKKILDQAVNFVKKEHQYRFLARLHDYTQIIASHDLPSPNNSERALLKYYEKLIELKNLVEKKFSILILNDLHLYPLNIDETQNLFYGSVAKCINEVNKLGLKPIFKRQRYYIHRIRPFFVNQKVFVERRINLITKAELNHH